MAVNIRKDAGSMRDRKPDLSTLVYGKIPPQAQELEEAVLGAILLERDRLEEVLEILADEAVFYADANQKIFAAIRRLFEKGIPVDLLTVVDELRRANELEIIGGAYYLTRLTQNVVSSANVEAHSRLILEQYMKREQIRIGGSMVTEAYDDSCDVFDTMDHAQEQLFQLTTTGIRKDFAHVGKTVTATIIERDEQIERRIEFNGVPTPFHNLNAATGGWQRKHLIIIAARPGVGKTAFSLCCAMACATDTAHGGGVGIFNLEMDADQLVKRLYSNISGVPLEHIMKPWLLTAEERRLQDEAAAQLQRLPIYIDDTAGLGLIELRAKARRMKKKHGIKLLIVDYLQLMNADMGKAGNNREQEISKISRELKKMGKELDLPIIALSQLNRQVDTRADNEPQLSDLRESGAIEQDADIVCMVYQAGKKTLEQKPHLKGKVMFTQAKNRHGATGDYVYSFIKECQRWEEITEKFGSFRQLDPDEQQALASLNGQTAGYKTPVPETNDDLPF